MIDLYKLLEKQEYAEVEFADGVSLIIRYDSGRPDGQQHSAEWSNFSPVMDSSAKPPIETEWLMMVYGGKTARTAITAAIQARYPK